MRNILPVLRFLCCTWLALIVVRMAGGVAWPWRWVLAPAWASVLTLATLVPVAWLVDRAVRVWLFFDWVRTVRSNRRRSRLWREIQRRRAAGEPTFLLERELVLRHPDALEARRHQPPGKTS